MKEKLSLQDPFKKLLGSVAEFRAEGRVLNSKNLRDLEDAILKLSQVLESAMKRNEDQQTAGSVPSIQFTGKGIVITGIKPSVRLHAGERLGTLIERTMDEKKMSAKDIASDLPIRESAFVRIVSGLNSRPPDDVLEAIATSLGIDLDEITELADLDASDPVESFFF